MAGFDLRQEMLNLERKRRQYLEEGDIGQAAVIDNILRNAGFAGAYDPVETYDFEVPGMPGRAGWDDAFNAPEITAPPARSVFEPDFADAPMVDDYLGPTPTPLQSGASNATMATSVPGLEEGAVLLPDDPSRVPAASGIGGVRDGAGGAGSSAGAYSTPPVDMRTQEVIADLLKTDRSIGGPALTDGIRKRLFPETREKVLGALGQDSEGGDVLGRSLMAAGGAILAGPANIQRALGEGILAGVTSYRQGKEASLEDEYMRHKMRLEQMEMEEGRIDRAQKQSDRARRLQDEATERQVREIEMQRSGYRRQPDGSLRYDPSWVERSEPSLGDMGSREGKLIADMEKMIASLIQQGMPPEDARLYVQQRFGDAGMIGKSGDLLGGLVE